MNDPKKTADSIVVTLAAIVIAGGSLLVQAWLLLLVLGWLGVAVTLNFWQAVVVCILIQLLVK